MMICDSQNTEFLIYFYAFMSKNHKATHSWYIIMQTILNEAFNQWRFG